MKISTSINGRFYFFDLAKQLAKKSSLGQLITSYPYFKVKEWGIQREQVRSIVFIEIGNRLLRKLKLSSANSELVMKRIYGFFSYLILDRKIDVFIFFAGNGFNSKLVKTLKNNNVLCIAEDGSSHMLEQIKLIEDEWRTLGIHNETVQPKALLRETLLEYELADYIAVPSSFVKRTFIKHGVCESKIFVNPYGVDLSNFRQVRKDDKVFRVIFCGGLTIRKGSHYLLQAMYELDLENFEFWHIGGVAEEMKFYVEKYKSDKIIYKGTQPQSELYKYYSQGSVFVLPSIEEGLALVQLQAMACGLPLICSTNTGGEDLITKDGVEGFVIPIRNVDAIKEKILFLNSNPEKCAEMGRAAKRVVSEGFSWDDYGDRYHNFLLSVLNDKKHKVIVPENN